MADDIMRPGHPKRAKLDKVQREIAEFHADISGVQRAPLTPDDRRASLARRFDERLTGPARFHTFNGFLNPEHEFHKHQWPDEVTWGALAFLFGKDELIDRAATALEANRKDPAGLPLSERPAAIAKLREKLEAAERKEELEIVRLEAEGAVILRREDCNVDLVLSVHRGLEGGRAEPQPGPSEPVKERHINEGAQLYGGPPSTLRL